MNPEKTPNTQGNTQPHTPIPKNTNCPEVQFTQISNGHTEIIIEHCGQKYRLIATRHGKLVLNK